MSLKNIMPKKKMQTGGGTFLGPFATQAGQATPRQQFTPGFVPTRTGDTSPTINLPGQDPIDTGQERTIQPISQDEVRRREAKRQTEQIQANIDPTIASGPIDKDFRAAAIAGGAKAGMTEDQVLASSPAFQQTLVGYDPTLPRFTEFLGEEGIFQSFMRGLASPKAGLGIGLAALTGGFPLAVSAIASAGMKNVSKEQDAGFVKPLLGQDTRFTGAGAAPDVSAVPSFVTKDQALNTLAPTGAFSSPGAQFGIPSKSFSSNKHFDAGISVEDEAELISKGNFTDVAEGQNFIGTLVENGFDKDDIDIAIDPQADTSGLSPSLGFDPGEALGFGPGRG